MKLRRKRHYKKWWIITIILLVVICLTIALMRERFVSAPKPAVNLKQSKPPAALQSSPVQPAFSKTRYSVSDPTSLWVVVNKPRPLQPLTYVPADLSPIGGSTISGRAMPALKQMIDDAKIVGVTLVVQSGYRSYSYQTGLYNGYAAKDGQALADTYSARPGHSEHQTGLAVDIGGVTQPGCNLEQCFGSSSEGKWLEANAEKYGFIIRYKAQNQPITGYTAEPWHLRFVGTELAREMKKQNLSTLEEFFGVKGGAQY